MAEKLSRDMPANIAETGRQLQQRQEGKYSRDRRTKMTGTGQKREQAEYIFKAMTGT